ncbi:chaplin [Kitasatospora sp. NPDC056076]|uniref:chaplin n=1 Tax=Kitasatospora sp. NPDC056076 TaxID=3345703 RepID=UPI0035D56352
MRKSFIGALAAVGVVVAAAPAFAHAGAEAQNVHNPGVVSGNLVQVPVEVPINICGNSVTGIGVLNPAFGNTCVNAA